MSRHHTGLHAATFLLIFIVLAVSLVPALAQFTPTAKLAPTWRPGVQLDTDIGTVDHRFVDVEIYLNANVQFWAADFVCTVKGALLTDYVWDPPPSLPGTSAEPMVHWGGDWGVEGTDYISFPASSAYLSTTGTASTGNGYVDATGQLNFSATRLGTVTPMGLNGVNYTMLVATLRFKVIEFTPPKTSDTSPFACSMVQLLDRNGNKIVTATVTAPPALSVLDGYTISGTVQYQRLTGHNSIGISCSPSLGTITVAATGMFTVTTRNTLANFDCLFYGNKSDPSTTQQDDKFLAGRTRFTLDSSSYQLLPIVLRGGNTAFGGAETIDIADASAITGAWDTPNTLIDLTGDNKLNELDLAIVAGNFGLTEDLDYSHMVFGLPRDSVVLNNSRILFGDPRAGEVKPLVNSTTPAHWPMLSPDGTKVTFVKYDTASKRYLLNTAMTKTLPATASTILTMSATFKQDAFAPSWSPDGQQIAFICATADPLGINEVPTGGWARNSGDLCIIGADGRNFRQITADDSIKIFPPAWFNNNVVIFAGTSANTTCGGDLCFYDLARNVLAVVDTAIAVSPDVADMPLIRGSHLYYRFDDPTTEKIRVAVIGGYTTTFTIPAFPSPSHVNVTTNGATPISNAVDYYDVSPQLHIVFYDFGSTVFHNYYYSGTFGDWEEVGTGLHTDHSVDGYIGNPSWDEDPDTDTYLHALRATVDWVP